MPLTETRLRALKTKDKPYKVADQRGLYIEVTPAGGKLWRFRYRIGKIEKKLAIGSYPEVIAQLPIILAIVTGEPQMSGEFRAASRVDPRLFGDLRGGVLGLPLNRLRLGRYAERLAEAGSETVGDIVARLRPGSLGAGGGKAAEVAAKHANLLASCLRDDGLIDWPSYRTANGLTCLPASPTADAAEFVTTLRETVCDLLAACRITKRASEIYRLRTSRTLGSQMTLQAVADALDTHLPTVKREETVFLSFLNGVLIGHDFSKLPVWLDGRSTIYRWMAEGKFPKPVQLGGYSVAWAEDEVEAWITTRLK